MLIAASILVAGAVIAVRVLTSPERIRAMVAAKLGEVCRGDFTVRSARLRLLRGRLEIEGVEIRPADPALADPPAVKVESIRADISLWNLIFGGDVVRSVEASGVEVNRIETADGRSNFSGLFAPPAVEPQAGGGRPSLRIRGQARLFRAGTEPAPTYEARSPLIDLELTPDVRRAGFYAFHVSAEGTPIPPVYGSVRVDGPLRVELSAAEVPLCPQVADALPPRLRRIWSAFALKDRVGPEGRLTQVTALWDLERSLMTFQASFERLAAAVPTYRLKPGRSSTEPPPQTPDKPTSDYAYVTDAAGRLEFDGVRLAVQGRALVNGRSTEFTAGLEGLGEPTAGIRAEVKMPLVEARESLWVYRDVNPVVDGLVNTVEPHARASLVLSVDRPAGPRLNTAGLAEAWRSAAAVLPTGLPQLPAHELEPHLRVAGTVEVVDGSIRPQPFPYLIEGVAGRIEFGSRQAVMEFTGRHGPARAAVRGRTTWGSGKYGGIDLDIRAAGMPLDSDLESALPQASRTLYRTLAPAGVCDLAVYVDSPEDTDDFRVEVHIHLDGRADFTLPVPKLRVCGARGTVVLNISRYAPPHIGVYNVVGSAAGGTLTVNGCFGVDRAGRDAYWVEFDATAVELSDRIEELLDEADRARLRDLKVAGRFHAAGRVFRSDPGPTEYDIVVGLSGAAMSPAALPRPVEQATGRLRITRELVELRDFTGRAGGAALAGSATLRPADGTYELHLAAGNVVLDRDLYDAVRPEVRAHWDRLRPDGPIDVKARLTGSLRDPLAPRAEVDVTARGLSLRPADFPYPLTDVHGTVSIRPGAVRFDNVKARHGQAEWVMGGTWLQRGNVGQVELRLSGKTVPLDEDLRNALPPAARESLRGLDPRGTFDPEVNLAAGTEAGRISGWQFDGRLGIRDGSVSVGRRLENIRGQVRGRGEFFTDSGRWTVAGDFTVECTKFIELEATQVVGRFEKRADTDRLVLTQLSGKTCAGRFNGQASVELRENGRYDAKLTADDMDLFDFWRGYTGKAASMSGRFRAVLAARGSLQSVADLEMAGDFVCRNGRLGETLPDEVAGRRPLKPGAALNATNSFGFDGMSLRYRRRGDAWTFEDIIVEGSGVRLAGRGNVSPKDEVDMVFVIIPPSDGARVPLIGELIRGVTNELVQLRVAGSTAQPKISQRNLDQLGTPLRDLLRTVRPLFVDDKKEP